MKQYFLYLIRWQLSTPIIALVLYILHTNQLIETIIANLIGSMTFYFIDKRIFKH